MDDHPPKRYMGPVTILIVASLVVVGSIYIATQLNERPEEIAGRTEQDRDAGERESPTAQNPRLSDEQRRGVPGLPKQPERTQ